MEISVTDLYDIKKVSESDFKKIIKKYDSNIIQLFRQIKGIFLDLQKIGITCDLIPLPLSENGIYWSDYAGDLLKEKYGDNYYNMNIIHFTVYLDREGQNINLKKDIMINFDVMKKDMKEKVITIFLSKVHKNYEWTGNNNDAMIIHFEEGNYEIPNFDNLKDDDTYPQLVLSIEIFDNKLEDVPKLKFFNDLKELIKNYEYKSQESYSMNNIDIEINSIEDYDAYDLYSQILVILENSKNSKKEKKKERVKGFSAIFNSDSNTYYVLEKSKYLKKNKKDLTFNDFKKKYKN